MPNAFGQVIEFECKERSGACLYRIQLYCPCMGVGTHRTWDKTEMIVIENLEELIAEHSNCAKR